MMINKNWYKSKTVWCSVSVAVIGVYQSVSGQVVPEAVYAILAALGLYGIRDAVDKVNKDA